MGLLMHGRTLITAVLLLALVEPSNAQNLLWCADIDSALSSRCTSGCSITNNGHENSNCGWRGSIGILMQPAWKAINVAGHWDSLKGQINDRAQIFLETRFTTNIVAPVVREEFWCAMGKV